MLKCIVEPLRFPGVLFLITSDDIPWCKEKFNASDVVFPQFEQNRTNTVEQVQFKLYKTHTNLNYISIFKKTILKTGAYSGVGAAPPKVVRLLCVTRT